MFFLVSWISLIWLLFLGLPQLDFDSIKCDSHKRLRSQRYVYIPCWSFTSCTWWSLLPTGINTRCIGLAPRDTVGQPKAIKLGKVAYHDFRYCFTSPLIFYRSTQFFFNSKRLVLVCTLHLKYNRGNEGQGIIRKLTCTVWVCVFQIYPCLNCYSCAYILLFRLYFLRWIILLRLERNILLYLKIYDTTKAWYPHSIWLGCSSYLPERK